MWTESLCKELGMSLKFVITWFGIRIGPPHNAWLYYESHYESPRSPYPAHNVNWDPIPAWWASKPTRLLYRCRHKMLFNINIFLSVKLSIAVYMGRWIIQATLVWWASSPFGRTELNLHKFPFSKSKIACSMKESYVFIEQFELLPQQLKVFIYRTFSWSPGHSDIAVQNQPKPYF